MTDLTGRIVEFLSAGRLKTALVRGESRKGLAAVDVNGRELTLNPKHVIVRHESVSDPARFGEEVQRLEQRVEGARSEIDLELLWESLDPHDRPVSLDELVREYFGEEDSAYSSALFRSIMEEPILFKLKGKTIHPLNRDQAAERRTALERRRQKKAIRDRVTSWMRETLDNPEEAAGTPEGLETVAADLEAFLVKRRTSDASQWLAQLDRERNPREMAFEILQSIGYIPADADPLLLVAGINPRFSAPALAQSENLEPFPGEESRTDFSALDAFSVDDEGTEEIDDAITLEKVEGGLRVGVHIADVACFLNVTDPLYREALDRCSSIYLPSGTVLMFPERLSTDLFSLRIGELRPTLSCLVDFDDFGKQGRWRFVPGQIRVRHRLSYAQVDESLGSAGDESWESATGRLDGLTRVLRTKREENGALNIEQPELKILADGDRVRVEVIQTSSPARRIISELMILANSLAAQYAFLKQVPIIYRAQQKPRERVAVPQEYDPVKLSKVFRHLNRSKLSTVLQPHSGLGLGGYTQLTSPIRRVVDLVIQHQLSAHLGRRALPFDQQELMEILSAAEAVQNDIKTVERKANRLYLLRFLQSEHLGRKMDAVVVLGIRSGYVVETTDLYVRGVLKGPSDLRPGDRVTVEIDAIDPDKDRLVFRLAEVEQ